jgi:hypothetical protein
MYVVGCTPWVGMMALRKHASAQYSSGGCRVTHSTGAALEDTCRQQSIRRVRYQACGGSTPSAQGAAAPAAHSQMEPELESQGRFWLVQMTGRALLKWGS